MRIVHVLHSFDTGGMEKGVATLISNASPGLEHVVVCLTRSGAAARLLPSGTRVIEMHKTTGNSARFIWRLSRTLRELQPTVVHTRNWGGVDGVIAARLAGLRRVVHGEHGWTMDDPYGASRKRIWIRRGTARWIDEFTCVSRQMRDWLVDQVRVARPVTQIYNGIDTTRYGPGDGGSAARQVLEIPADAYVVGTVGRLDPIKNHPALFRAFADLRKTRPDARLLVVGDGAERRRLEALAGAGVCFLGDRDDVPALLPALDVFVLPSFNEGISNTILEAMATARPVVATAVGGNGELVRDGETGTLVPVDDAEAIQHALERYAAKPELRRRHGEAGRDRAEGEFSVRAMVTAYETVWARVASALLPSPESQNRCIRDRSDVPTR